MSLFLCHNDWHCPESGFSEASSIFGSIGISAALRARASELRRLCPHTAGAFLSQPEAAIHRLSPTDKELLFKVSTNYYN